MIEIDPYEKLANTIIMQAVKDYRAAKKKQKKQQTNKDAELMVKDTEKFFRSDWFTALTDVDGAVILRKLQEE